MDTRGKNTQAQDQIRIRAALTVGPETKKELEGILGRWGRLWLPARDRILTSVTQEKTFIIIIIIIIIIWLIL